MTSDDKTLLLVEDDRPLRERLARAMEARGFTVTQAESVAEGKARAKEAPPAYAVVDLKLDDGNGLDVVETLHTTRPESRVVVLTGFGNIATAVAAVKYGAIDYLPKPADADDILAALMATPGSKPKPPENPMSADRVRWEHIQRVYELCGHNVSETARRLNMHRRTLAADSGQAQPALRRFASFRPSSFSRLVFSRGLLRHALFFLRLGIDLAPMRAATNSFSVVLSSTVSRAKQHRPGLVMIGDVEKPWLGFQHHVAHLDGADAQRHRVFLVMHPADKALGIKNRRLAEIGPFGCALHRQHDLAGFSLAQHRASPDWGFQTVPSHQAARQPFGRHFGQSSWSRPCGGWHAASALPPA